MRPAWNPSLEPALPTGSGSATQTMRSVFLRGGPGRLGGYLFLKNTDLTNTLLVKYGAPDASLAVLSECYQLAPGEAHVFPITAPMYASHQTVLVGCLVGSCTFSYAYDATYATELRQPDAVIA